MVEDNRVQLVVQNAVLLEEEQELELVVGTCESYGEQLEHLSPTESVWLSSPHV